MAEKNITVEQVEREHLEEVNPIANALYVAAVLGLSFLLMLAFIAWLGAAGG